MKQAREMAEEAGTNIRMVPRIYRIQMHRENVRAATSDDSPAKTLQFHFWTTCGCS